MLIDLSKDSGFLCMIGVLEERPGCRNYYLAGIISRFSAISVHTLAATLDLVRNDYVNLYGAAFLVSH